MRLNALPSADPRLHVAVSGSFHRHMAAITAVVHELASLSIRVLSPSDPRVVAHQGEFLFVASDRLRSVRLVQDRHLESISAADFLWLVCPDGYVGQSASMEVGFAAAAGVPVFCAHAPTDLTLRQYVTVVPDVRGAISIVAASGRNRHAGGMLINPHASVEEAHRILEELELALAGKAGNNNPEQRVARLISDLQTTIETPPISH